jgi:hypothetical protein
VVGASQAGGGSGKADEGGQKTAGQAAGGGPRPVVTAQQHAQSAPNDPLATFFFGVLFMVVATILFAAIVEVWPAVPTGASSAAAASSGQVHAVHLVFGLFVIHVTADTSLLVLVILAAAIGAFVHAATSFADFVGNRRFVASWAWWYALRLFIGVALALLLYFAVRGGFLSTSSTSADINPYGIAALAGLSGLFSKQATDKLREVFETMFRVRDDGGDATRKDDLENPKPMITGTDPVRATANQDLRLTVIGNGFVDGTTVMVNDTSLPTQCDSAHKQLTVTIPAVHVTDPKLTLVVVSPPPGGGSSDPFDLPVS